MRVNHYAIRRNAAPNKYGGPQYAVALKRDILECGRVTDAIEVIRGECPEATIEMSLEVIEDYKNELFEGKIVEDDPNF